MKEVQKIRALRRRFCLPLMMKKDLRQIFFHPRFFLGFSISTMNFSGNTLCNANQALNCFVLLRETKHINHVIGKTTKRCLAEH